MINITIKSLFSDDYVTREAGEKLRKLIIEAASENDSICLDFTGVTVASTSFLDEGIAKLSQEDWDQEKFNKTVKFLNCHKGDQALIKKLCKIRGLNIKL